MTSRRRFSNWIKSYMEYCEHTEAPYDFHYWTAVSTIAGALRRKVWFDQRIFRWYPNFYIVFVARPGVATKGTTMKFGMNMLREIEGIHFGPNTLTWQTLPRALNESKMLAAPATSDFMNTTFEQMCCLTFDVAELGTFLRFDDGEMIDLLVDLWDGNTYKKMTKFSGDDHVVNPWLNIIAATTPAWLQQNMPKVMVGGGFVSRCIFVKGDEKRQLIPYPADHTSPELDKLRKELVYDLGHIAEMFGEMRLTPEAHAWGSDWYRRLHTSPNPESESDANFRSRMQCHIHKLAMVLSAARGDSMLLDVEVLKEAATIIEAIEESNNRILGRVGRLPSYDVADQVFALIKRHGQLRKYLLYKTFMTKVRNLDEFDEIIRGGIAAGFVVQTQINNELFVRWQEPEANEQQIAN